MYKFKFTIFTPTYNRAYILENLYNDLKKQTFKDFEWLIVDDGSSDNTKQLVDKFILEDKLNINYIYKQNGGKHTAINTGIKNANGELFFIVDSDDRLLNESLKVVNDTWRSVDNKKELSGVVGLCVDTENEIVGTQMPEDKDICHFTDLYFKYGVKGDKSIIFTTDVIKQYSFPEIEGIKFLPESVVWHEISKKYKIKCINKPLRIVEYLDDGLTKNKFNESSLKGRCIEFLYLINQNTYPVSKYPYMWVKNYINLSRYSLMSNSSYFKDINRISNKVMYILLFPLGYFKYARQK
ncbi:glycosyltransferase family 2 protein [Romboutsia sp.]|uniref:glycosyltransferase family 2 protein n=1 Tax=Romboutsia sp. TaxID=1965302 RepID=UPI003F350848